MNTPKKYIIGWFRAPLKWRPLVLAVKPARADGGKYPLHYLQMVLQVHFI